MAVSYARGDELPLPTPKIDPSANKLYVECAECGARRSAAWRDRAGRIAVCTVCIQRSLDQMVTMYRERRARMRREQAELRRANRRARLTSRHEP